MAVYDKTDPTAPELVTLCTTKERDERFASVGASDGAVRCLVRLNPSYEAHFSMTPDHARDVAVRLIDAAEEAEAQAEAIAKAQAAELKRVQERHRAP